MVTRKACGPYNQETRRFKTPHERDDDDDDSEPRSSPTPHEQWRNPRDTSTTSRISASTARSDIAHGGGRTLFWMRGG